MPEIPPGTHDPEGGDLPSRSGGGSVRGQRGNQGASPSGVGEAYRGSTSTGAGGAARSSREPTKRSPGNSHGARPFISYIRTHPNDEDVDPDGLEQAARMRIEEQAIAKIIQLEPLLKRTPNGNPGYDLYEPDATGNPMRWVEVKSMTGSLEDRPVGLSHTQFDLAWGKRESYWLYIVEYANDPQRARLRRIQDPAGQARTYTFDRGWSAVAQTEFLRQT